MCLSVCHKKPFLLKHLKCYILQISQVLKDHLSKVYLNKHTLLAFSCFENVTGGFIRLMPEITPAPNMTTSIVLNASKNLIIYRLLTTNLQFLNYQAMQTK